MYGFLEPSKTCLKLHKALKAKWVNAAPGWLHLLYTGKILTFIKILVQVHMRDVTVFADEHAALQLVSQGSIQSAARRVSRSKQEPLLDMERRRSHSRASTPTATDMQTGAPSLDFQIM